MIKVAVAGGSDFNDAAFIDYYLSTLHWHYVFEEVLSGSPLGKSGKLVKEWAKKNEIPFREIKYSESKADRHKSVALNLLNCFPDLIVVFPGKEFLYTKAVMRLARMRRISMIIYHYNSVHEKTRSSFWYRAYADGRKNFDPW